MSSKIELLRTFIIGGGVIAIAVYLSEQFGNKYSALFWSFPLAYLVSIYTFYRTKTKKSLIVEYGKDIVKTTPNYMIFIWSFSKLLEKYPNMNPILITFYSIIPWAVSALFTYKILE